MDKEAGIFLGVNECKALFPRLKLNESSLSQEERSILLAIEKILYGKLSIQDVEDLLQEGAVPPEPGIPGKAAGRGGTGRGGASGAPSGLWGRR